MWKTQADSTIFFNVSRKSDNLNVWVKFTYFKSLLKNKILQLKKKPMSYAYDLRVPCLLIHILFNLPILWIKTLNIWEENKKGTVTELSGRIWFPSSHCTDSCSFLKSSQWISIKMYLFLNYLSSYQVSIGALWIISYSLKCICGPFQGKQC